jgi:exocyst complex component 6
VTASLKTWLFDLRNVSRQVGRLALDAMEVRKKRWAARKEKEPQLKLCQLGGAVELITSEKIECKHALLSLSVRTDAEIR